MRALLVSLLLFLAAPGGSAAGPEGVARQPLGALATAPVVAVAGDIACDPSGSSYHDGLGTATACRQKDTSDLLFDRAGGLFTRRRPTWSSSATTTTTSALRRRTRTASPTPPAASASSSSERAGRASTPSPAAPRTARC